MIAAILAYVYKLFLKFQNIWTDARASFLDASISSRAPSSTALNKTVWTDSHAGWIVKLNTGGIPGTLKSIQRGHGNLQATSTLAQTINISTVNMSKSRLSLNGVLIGISSSSGFEGMPFHAPIRGRIASSTSIEIYPQWAGGISSPVTLHYAWEVIEYY